MRPKLRYSSLTSRTLVPIAVGVTLIVALASAVSYYLMYRDIQQRASDQLKLHVEERGRTEQQVFLFARDSQAAIRRAVLNGYDGYMGESIATRFDQLFDALSRRGNSQPGQYDSRPGRGHRLDSQGHGGERRVTPAHAAVPRYSAAVQNHLVAALRGHLFHLSGANQYRHRSARCSAVGYDCRCGFRSERRRLGELRR